MPPSWLHNNHTFVMDMESSEASLAKLPLTLEEIIFIAWVRHIHAQLHEKNFSYIAGFEGRHRSGKSLGAVLLAYLVDRTFWDRMEQRIVKTPQEFMREIDIIAKEKIKGAVIIIDEGGVVVPSEEYFQEWYKTLSRVFQMFGYLNPCVLFCAVLRDAIGAKFRKMFHSIVRVKRISNDFSYFTVYDLEYNPMFAKYIHSRPKLRIAGRSITLKRLKIGMPPKFIVERYTNLALLQKTEMLEGFGEKIKQLGKGKQKPEINIAEVMDYVVKNYQLFKTKRSKPGEPILNANDLRIKFGLTAKDADYVKRHSELKLKETFTGGDNGVKTGATD